MSAAALSRCDVKLITWGLMMNVLYTLIEFLKTPYTRDQPIMDSVIITVIEKKLIPS